MEVVMKANEAPEKIYLPNNPVLFISNLNERTSEDDIEYTRTDAFIEKAVNFLEMLGYGFTITDNITHTNYDKEQLIADFRNYMEGK